MERRKGICIGKKIEERETERDELRERQRKRDRKRFALYFLKHFFLIWSEWFTVNNKKTTE